MPRTFIRLRLGPKPLHLTFIAAAAITSLLVSGASASARSSQPTGTAAKATKAAERPKPSRSLRIVPQQPIAAGDELVLGRGDSDGWHIYATAGGSPGTWRPLATLAPAAANPNGERWIGRQCLTGNGRFVVAVVAPWSANNSQAGMDRAGIAYVIDAHSGSARPLLAGVSLHYFTPSCGVDGTAALTRYVGTNEQTTQVIRVDTAAVKTVSVVTTAGELTSAVPTSDGGFTAARGHEIVHVNGGRTTVAAAVDGQPFNLVANTSGGVDFLVGRGQSATVWSLDKAGARQVGAGDFRRLALYPGRSGHTIAVGTTHVDPGAHIKSLPPTVETAEAVSSDGSMIGAAPVSDEAPPGQAPHLPLLLTKVTGVRAGKASSWTPDVAAPATRTMPGILTDAGSVVAVPSSPPASAPSSGTAKKSTTAPGTGTKAGSAPAYVSDCAVGRNDVYLQAMQPSPQDVAWAANLAGRSLLTGQYARPANYENLNLPFGYSPSLDFPLPAPFGSGGASVPREVLEGIFAQESNFNQASWHSVQGVAGNPLIADYYGADGGYVAGVVNPDCGYGLGQITTGMHTGEMSYDLQRKVAVDYVENVAASAQILAKKWNELAAAGIVVNNGDPGTLENWYTALWSYNSGLHPDTGGPWGLGWANNPVNPAYPFNRQPFLRNSYADASHPGDWPYQERVFGWMEMPLKNPLSGASSYSGVWDSRNKELARPAIDQFCDATNECNMTQNPQCSRADFECWWHQSTNWCSLFCTDGSWEYGAGDPEPPAQGSFYPLPECNVASTDVPAGAIIVDSQPADANLQGCDPAVDNWQSSGSFAFSYGDPAHPGSQQTDMDVHQLGAGLGGHLWFTHTNEPTDLSGSSLWGVTGTWTPNLPKGRFEVKVFMPSAGATATEAKYVINNGLGLSHTVMVNQNAYTDQWVSLGKFWLGPGASVALTNLGTSTDGDLAFTGVAFAPTSNGRYAMLGDSYSSGEGARVYDSNTFNTPTFCLTTGSSCKNNGHRSPLSYNRVFAAGTSTFGKVTDWNSADPAKNWQHAACSNAVVADMFSNNPDNLCPDEPAQLDALNSDTSLVTMTIGGNDLEFAPVIESCVYHGLNPLNSLLPGCREKYSAQVDANLAQLTSQGLPNVLQNIKSRAPDAEVVLLGYPRLVMGPGGSGNRCWANGRITDDDQQWLNDTGEKVDQALSDVAAKYDVTYISTTATFTGHELCSADSYFTGILDGTPPNDTYADEDAYVKSVPRAAKQEFFHPNEAGYASEAALLHQRLQIP